MTDEIKDKLKQMIDTSGVIASDVADYIIDLEDRIIELVEKKSFLEKENFKLREKLERVE